MAAEEIAQVIARLRSRTVRNTAARKTSPMRDIKEADKLVHGILDAVKGSVVVDGTALYLDLAERPRDINLFDDHPQLQPPFERMAVCYRNEHGNAIVMVGNCDDVGHHGVEPAWEDAIPECDWSRVRWLHRFWLFLGGHGSDGEAVDPPYGPLIGWWIAVYGDGRPADIRWIQVVPEYDLDNWDMAQCVLLGTLNFLNCRNVELVDAATTRGERRRMERVAPGIHVKTLSVFPVGRSSTGGRSSGVGVPLTTVRGHLAHYGACCPDHEPRGLLFGKIQGRFFIPQHARGTAELGEHRNDYKVRT